MNNSTTETAETVAQIGSVSVSAKLSQLRQKPGQKAKQEPRLRLSQLPDKPLTENDSVSRMREIRASGSKRGEATLKAYAW